MNLVPFGGYTCIYFKISIFPFLSQEHRIDATHLAQMIEEDLENLGIPKV